ncbi:MAG TPA: ABC transporter permease [Chitinophagaceae bacterium]|nr:ABC transporter permease [Chitinophagaceae bacterium]
MFRNYFKTAWRGLWRRRSFSIINISGLAIGIAATMLIALWIQNELSFDRWYKKTDRIYQVFHREISNGKATAWGNSPDVLAPVLKKDCPEIEDAVRVVEDESLLSVQDKHLKSSGVFADAGFLYLFDFPLQSGNAKSALNTINSIVITESLAKRLFGDEAATGKMIRLDTADNFIVTAVLKDLPGNSSFHFDYVLPWVYGEKIYGKNENWTAYNDKTYVLLRQGADINKVNKKIEQVAQHYAAAEDKAVRLTQFLYPAMRWHLYDRSENGQMVSGQMDRVKLFALLAGLILLIACINFINLSTARSEKRAKEVGIRKVVGAPRQSLIFQFILESILLAFVAGIIAILMVQACLPAYNKLLQTDFNLPLRHFFFWLYWSGFIVLTGLLSGCYPAFFLSSFNAAKVLKSSFKSTGKIITPRKALVVMQFTFAVILVISTLIIVKEIKYAQNRDTGFDTGQLVFSPLEGGSRKNYALIRQELLSSGVVLSVTKSLVPISASWTSNMWGYEWQGSTPEESRKIFDVFSTDAGFTKTLGTRIIAGRDIDIYNYPTDSSAILLSEKAVEVMHLKNPIGQTIIRSSDEVYHVVGVINDFLIGSPYNNIQPMVVMGPKYGWFRTVHYRLNAARPIRENLSKIEQVFKKYNREYPFEYQFVDAAYAEKFKGEQTTGKLTALFAGLAIFISCLGLFGLAAYMAENRVKEIGVRKVLGASVTSVTMLLSKDFVKLVCIAILIASPIASFAMHKWLESYQYRINIGWPVFVASGLLAIMIALVTVSFQSVKAATANPVNSLRTE